MLCRRFLVSGRVQGVFYRASTVTMARQLQLRGFVRNLSDGRVELVACGEESALIKLYEWLWQGPSRAEVDKVFSEQADSPVSYSTFEVL